MELPGHKLIRRLWETLSPRGVGVLLSRAQARLERLDETEVHRHRLIALLQAEKGAEELRVNGSKAETVPEVASPLKGTTEPLIHLPPGFGTDEIAKVITASVITDAVRSEVNVARAVLHAERELGESSQEPPTARIHDDWLFRWRDAAGAVSQEELQALWGRVLAGEIKSPGSVSLRTLEFLRNLSQDEAKDIERLSPLAVAGFVLRDDAALEEANINLGFLLRMQDLGVIFGVESVGLILNFNTVQRGSYVRLFRSHDRGVLVNHPDHSKVLTLPVYQLSAIGQQVLALGRYRASESTLRHCGRIVCGQGFEAFLVDCQDVGGGQMTRYTNPATLCPRPESGLAN